MRVVLPIESDWRCFVGEPHNAVWMRVQQIAIEGMGEMQRELGDYFSATQNGRYTSPRVAEALAKLAADGIAGIGQSSWGPTGFALVESASRAAGIEAEFKAHAAFSGLQFRSVAGANHGAEISIT